MNTIDQRITDCHIADMALSKVMNSHKPNIGDKVGFIGNVETLVKEVRIATLEEAKQIIIDSNMKAYGQMSIDCEDDVAVLDLKIAELKGEL